MNRADFETSFLQGKKPSPFFDQNLALSIVHKAQNMTPILQAFPHDGDSYWNDRVIKWIDEGDQTAMQEVVTHFSGPLFKVAYAFAGDDDVATTAVTETFLKINRRKPGSYKNRGKPLLKFLTTILFFEVKTEKKRILRREIKHQKAVKNLLVLEKADHSDPVDFSSVLDSIGIDAFNSLTEVQRKILVLKHREKYTNQEIAEESNRPLAEVGNMYRKAIEEARNTFQNLKKKYL